MTARNSLYRNTVAGFIADVDAAHLPRTRAAEQTRIADGPPGPGEVTSRKRSLPALASVLRTEEVTSSEIMVELFMQSSSRRCDLVLIGRNAQEHGARTVLDDETRAYGQERLAAWEQATG